MDRLVGLVVKASALTAVDPISIPSFAVESVPGRVIRSSDLKTSTPRQVSGDIGPGLGQVVPVSV